MSWRNTTSQHPPGVLKLEFACSRDMCDRQDSQLLFFSACFKSFSPQDSLELKSVPPYNPTMQQTLAHISSIPIPQCCSATHRLESWEQFRLGLFYDKVHIDTPFDQVLLPSGQFTQHIPSDFFARWRQVLCDFQHRGILQECLASREFRFKPSGLRLALESLIEKRWSSQFRPIQRKSLSRHWFRLSLPIVVNSTYLEVSLKKAIHWLPCAAVFVKFQPDFFFQAARHRHKPCLFFLCETRQPFHLLTWSYLCSFGLTWSKCLHSMVRRSTVTGFSDMLQHFCLDLLRVAIWRKLPMLCRSLGFSGTQQYPCLHFLWLGWHGPLGPLIALSWRRAKKTWRHRRLRLRGPDVAFILHLSFLCHGWCSWLTPTRIYNVSKCKNIGPKANVQGPFVFVFLYLGCSPPHRTTCHSPAPHVYSLFLFKYHDMHVFNQQLSAYIIAIHCIIYHQSLSKLSIIVTLSLLKNAVFLSTLRAHTLQ